MGDYSTLTNTLRELNALAGSDDSTRDQFWSVAIEEYISKHPPKKCDSLQRRLATLRLLDRLEKDALLPSHYIEREHVRVMNESSSTDSTVRRRNGLSHDLVIQPPSTNGRLPVVRSREKAPVHSSNGRFSGIQCTWVSLLLAIFFSVINMALFNMPSVVIEDVSAAPRLKYTNPARKKASRLAHPTATAHAAIAKPRNFHLSVQFMYFESPEMPECEKVNKRTNLEFFIQAAVLKQTSASPSETISFLFMYSGSLPNATEYFSSLGVPKARHRTHIFPSLPNVRLERMARSSTDLCPHATALRNSTAKSLASDSFVLLLNDGTRGPFVRDDQMVDPLYPKVPVWFLPFWNAFNSNSMLSVMGSFMSKQRKVHVQSFALVIKTESFDVSKHLEILMQSCHPNLNKGEIIFKCEIGLSQAVLARGRALASLEPPLRNFTKWHDVKSAGFRRTNPTFHFKGPPEKTVFVKMGGYPWRNNCTQTELMTLTVNRTSALLQRNASWTECRLHGEQKN